MKFIANFLMKLLRKSFNILFKTANNKTGYVIRCTSSKSIYVKKDNEWADILDLIDCPGPLFDEIYTIIEEAIEKTGVPVKYRCSKCKETLVDDINELTPFGGLGHWCKDCIDKSE